MSCFVMAAYQDTVAAKWLDLCWYFSQTIPMIEMSLHEAQLFRMLESFFGRDRVVWNMSVRSVCGGEYPQDAPESKESIASWAEVAGCLFTVVDEDDNPKMVVEFESDLSQVIDLAQLDRQQRLPKLLEQRGVQYIVVTRDEFAEILDPNGSLDLISVLQDRLGLDRDEAGDLDSD
jgi:hypothetical protein